jgi:hypothetical protein
VRNCRDRATVACKRISLHAFSGLVSHGSDSDPIERRAGVRAMWRMSNVQTLIFVAVVAVAVALLALA